MDLLIIAGVISILVTSIPYFTWPIGKVGK